MKSVMNVQRNSFWSNFLLKRLFPFHDEDDVDRLRCNVEMNSFNALNRREKKLERYYKNKPVESYRSSSVDVTAPLGL